MSGPSGGEPAAPQGPCCYRHPSRETYIRCQRCSRPICPDCMREAPVGFHCPECVRDDNSRTRSPRTMVGSLVPRRAGVVTIVIIVINVVAFIATLATGGTNGSFFDWGAMLSRSAFDPTSGQVLTGVANGGWWRLITAAFLHEGFLHILFNMYALYIFGPMLEQLLGVRRFVAMYLTAALASSAPVYVLSPVNALTIGASGAIFGLFAVALVLLLRRGQDVRFLLVLLAINAVISLTGNVSWQGHLGGFIAGGILGLGFAFGAPRWRTLIQIGVFALVWAAIIVALVLRTAQLTA